MPSRIAQLADALKTRINADIVPSPNAKRVYAPDYDTTKTRSLQVAVVPPTGRASEALDRVSRTDASTLYVAVYRKLSTAAGDGSTEAANAEADAVIELAEKVYDLFNIGESIGGYSVRGVDHDPVFVPQYLRGFGVVASIVALQFDLP